ncbi:MAG: alanine--tRNA ligase [Acidobacteria bacterium]|nr:alanine--tRNA ligase [Acidobacteriota bacterium]
MTTPTTGSEVRSAFVEFFRDRQHTVVPSASLIPADPSLLLTVAGMVPFKPYLLGDEPAPYPRAVSSQKCIRTVDIDIVGSTARHMSFFEMLGNFSFGDYFKELACSLAYELITEHYGMDPDRLWFTVHEDDQEAEQIWIDGVGVSPDRVQRRPDSENFWQMGVPGPAGPASEIFYDRGPDFGPEGGPIVDEERFMEFWNLVFMQYVQDEPYHVVGDLPAKNIDTGLGLERTCVLLQDVANVFDTDLVRPVLAAAEGATGHTYGEHQGPDVSLRIMADHGRAVTHMIADGIVPANEGRGYVLRRLLRRAVRHAWQLGAEETVTPALVDATIDAVGDAFPGLRSGRDGIVETAEREEIRFRRTLASGHTLLSRELDGLDEGGILPGPTAFKLHDTFGFPVELTEEITSERGLSVDIAAFEAEMEQQRSRARSARRIGADSETASSYLDLFDRYGPTTFVGYEDVDSEGVVLSILRDGEAVQNASEGAEVEIFFDVTPFYGESGGQIGDTGTASTETGALDITDTQHAVQGLHGHRAIVRSGTISVGQHAALAVAPARRERIRKSHTGTHILHWALREVLGTHVQQAGSLVEPGRLRFDFSHYGPLSSEEMLEVERVANERVIDNAPVQTIEMTRVEAEEIGAIAFFGDKYGDRVRVVEAGNYSRELCGGTHVPSTGQIGPLIVLGESSIGSNLRRIEAFTGSSGYEHLVQLRRELKLAAEHLRVGPDELGDAAAAIVARSRQQEDRIEAFEARSRFEEATSIIGEAVSVAGFKLAVAIRDGLSPDALRQLAVQVRDRLGSGVAVIGSERDGKAGLVGVVTADLVERGLSAADIVGPAARLVGGGGSRDPELAQAGGPQGAEIGVALEQASALATEALEGL